MAMTGAIIVPHPPLILPQVGRGQEAAIASTIAAYRAAAAKVAEWRPEALILATPHVVCYADYFHISPGEGAEGDMSAFEAPGLKLRVEYDLDLRREIIALAGSAGLQAGTLGERDKRLDHGAFIPLYFLREAGVSCPVVRMGLSGFSPLEHYRLGECAQMAALSLGRRVAFIASGDLSHKLRADGPYGYAKEGPEFDRAVTAAMAKGDFLSLLTMDAELAEGAAECGLRAFQMMAGALDGLAAEPELMSYEGPYGVGYGVAAFTVTGQDEARRVGEKYTLAERRRLELRRAGEDAWVRLARLSLEGYITGGRRLDEPPEGLPAELTESAAGAFVSLTLNGRLRGCIGTISPVCGRLWQEIARNAVSAGTEDPRFDPVTAEELPNLEYKVDVLGQPEDISSVAELDVKRYGVIVSRGRRRGLLLPDLAGVDTPEQQVDIARQKGGIGEDEPYTLQRFQVVRHT